MELWYFVSSYGHQFYRSKQEAQEAKIKALDRNAGEVSEITRLTIAGQNNKFKVWVFLWHDIPRIFFQEPLALLEHARETGKGYLVSEIFCLRD